MCLHLTLQTFLLNTFVYGPVGLFLLYCPLRFFVYKKYLGTYVGGHAFITIKPMLLSRHLPFINLNRFSIRCMESEKVEWTGTYQLDPSSGIMTGVYRWNTKNNPGIPDTGEHIIYFSPDGKQTFVKWKRLTGIHKEGSSKWVRFN